MLRIFKIFIVVGLAVIVGCGAARQGTSSTNQAREAIYMLIVNDGYDDIKVYDDFSKVATISSGQSACVRLRSPHRTIQFSFSYLASSGRWYAPRQNFSGSSGWEWTINSRMANNSRIRMNVAAPCGDHLLGVRYHR